MMRAPLEVADVFREGEARFLAEYGHTLSLIDTGSSGNCSHGLAIRLTDAQRHAATFRNHSRLEAVVTAA